MVSYFYLLLLKVSRFGVGITYANFLQLPLRILLFASPVRKRRFTPATGPSLFEQVIESARLPLFLCVCKTGCYCCSLIRREGE